MERYYSVTAKCGHVGKDKYIPIEFAIIAASGKEAAKTARTMPRVKHHHKDAIQDVQEISWDEYCLLQFKNRNDPYFHCSSIQEQRMYMEIYDRIVEENNEESFRAKENKSEKVYFVGKKQLRNVKKYAKSQPESVRISIVRDSYQAA